MHVFFYDPILNNKKFALLLAKIETKITDLGLGGKIIRLTLLHNLEKAILDESKPGQTLIFIGSDQILSQALPTLANKDLTIGYIPILSKQVLATALGIPGPLEACEILAARRIIKTDLVQANNNAFLTDVLVKSPHCTVDIDEMSVEIATQSELKIVNLPLAKSDRESLPDDQLLELIVATKNKNNFFEKTTESQSFFQATNFLITADHAEAILDSTTIIPLPIRIHILPLALSIIVGKERNF